MKITKSWSFFAPVFKNFTSVFTISVFVFSQVCVIPLYAQDPSTQPTQDLEAGIQTKEADTTAPTGTEASSGQVQTINTSVYEPPITGSTDAIMTESSISAVEEAVTEVGGLAEKIVAEENLLVEEKTLTLQQIGSKAPPLAFPTNFIPNEANSDQITQSILDSFKVGGRMPAGTPVLTSAARNENQDLVVSIGIRSTADGPITQNATFTLKDIQGVPHVAETQWSSAENVLQQSEAFSYTETGQINQYHVEGWFNAQGNPTSITDQNYIAGQLVKSVGQNMSPSGQLQATATTLYSGGTMVRERKEYMDADGKLLNWNDTGYENGQVAFRFSEYGGQTSAEINSYDEAGNRIASESWLHQEGPIGVFSDRYSLNQTVLDPNAPGGKYDFGQIFINGELASFFIQVGDQVIGAGKSAVGWTDNNGQPIADIQQYIYDGYKSLGVFAQVIYLNQTASPIPTVPPVTTVEIIQHEMSQMIAQTSAELKKYEEKIADGTTLLTAEDYAAIKNTLIKLQNDLSDQWSQFYQLFGPLKPLMTREVMTWEVYYENLPEYFNSPEYDAIADRARALLMSGYNRWIAERQVITNQFTADIERLRQSVFGAADAELKPQLAEFESRFSGRTELTMEEYEELTAFFSTINARYQTAQNDYNAQSAVLSQNLQNALAAIVLSPEAQQAYNDANAVAGTRESYIKSMSIQTEDSVWGVKVFEPIIMEKMSAALWRPLQFDLTGYKMIPGQKDLFTAVEKLIFGKNVTAQIGGVQVSVNPSQLLVVLNLEMLKVYGLKLPGVTPEDIAFLGTPINFDPQTGRKLVFHLVERYGDSVIRGGTVDPEAFRLKLQGLEPITFPTNFIPNEANSDQITQSILDSFQVGGRKSLLSGTPVLTSATRNENQDLVVSIGIRSTADGPITQNATFTLKDIQGVPRVTETQWSTAENVLQQSEAFSYTDAGQISQYRQENFDAQKNVISSRSQDYINGQMVKKIEQLVDGGGRFINTTTSLFTNGQRVRLVLENFNADSKLLTRDDQMFTDGKLLSRYLETFEDGRRTSVGIMNYNEGGALVSNNAWSYSENPAGVFNEEYSTFQTVLDPNAVGGEYNFSQRFKNGETETFFIQVGDWRVAAGDQIIGATKINAVWMDRNGQPIADIQQYILDGYKKLGISSNPIDLNQATPPAPSAPPVTTAEIVQYQMSQMIAQTSAELKKYEDKIADGTTLLTAEDYAAIKNSLVQLQNDLSDQWSQFYQLFGPLKLVMERDVYYENLPEYFSSPEYDAIADRARALLMTGYNRWIAEQQPLNNQFLADTERLRQSVFGAADAELKPQLAEFESRFSGRTELTMEEYEELTAFFSTINARYQTAQNDYNAQHAVLSEDYRIKLEAVVLSPEAQQAYNDAYAVARTRESYLSSKYVYTEEEMARYGIKVLEPIIKMSAALWRPPQFDLTGYYITFPGQKDLFMAVENLISGKNVTVQIGGGQVSVNPSLLVGVLNGEMIKAYGLRLPGVTPEDIAFLGTPINFDPQTGRKLVFHLVERYGDAVISAGAVDSAAFRAKLQGFETAAPEPTETLVPPTEPAKTFQLTLVDESTANIIQSQIGDALRLDGQYSPTSLIEYYFTSIKATETDKPVELTVYETFIDPITQTQTERARKFQVVVDPNISPATEDIFLTDQTINRVPLNAKLILGLSTSDRSWSWTPPATTSAGPIELDPRFAIISPTQPDEVTRDLIQAQTGDAFSLDGVCNLYGPRVGASYDSTAQGFVNDGKEWEMIPGTISMQTAYLFTASPNANPDEPVNFRFLITTQEGINQEFLREEYLMAADGTAVKVPSAGPTVTESFSNVQVIIDKTLPVTDDPIEIYPGSPSPVRIPPGGKLIVRLATTSKDYGNTITTQTFASLVQTIASAPTTVTPEEQAVLTQLTDYQTRFADKPEVLFTEFQDVMKFLDTLDKNNSTAAQTEARDALINLLARKVVVMDIAGTEVKVYPTGLIEILTEAEMNLPEGEVWPAGITDADLAAAGVEGSSLEDDLRLVVYMVSHYGQTFLTPEGTIDEAAFDQWVRGENPEQTSVIVPPAEELPTPTTTTTAPPDATTIAIDGKYVAQLKTFQDQFSGQSEISLEDYNNIENIISSIRADYEAENKSYTDAAAGIEKEVEALLSSKNVAFVLEDGSTLHVSPSDVVEVINRTRRDIGIEFGTEGQQLGELPGITAEDQKGIGPGEAAGGNLPVDRQERRLALNLIQRLGSSVANDAGYVDRFALRKELLGGKPFETVDIKEDASGNIKVIVTPNFNQGVVSLSLGQEPPPLITMDAGNKNIHIGSAVFDVTNRDDVVKALQAVTSNINAMPLDRSSAEGPWRDVLEKIQEFVRVNSAAVQVAQEVVAAFSSAMSAGGPSQSIPEERISSFWTSGSEEEEQKESSLAGTTETRLSLFELWQRYMRSKYSSGQQISGFSE